MDHLIQLLALAIVKLVQFIQPFLVPLCFVSAWVVLALAVWHVVAATCDGLAQARQMHQIPCPDCQYFTNSHFLKCPIHPANALTETAIGCPDYQSANPLGTMKDTRPI